MKEVKDYMGWNAPGSGSGGNGEQRDQDSSRDQDPWGRNTRRQQEGFDAEKFFEQLKKLFFGRQDNRSGGGSSGGSKSVRSMFSLVLLVLIGLYVFAGFYTVKEAERGVVLRFGKIYEVVDPGLRWNFTGIDTVNVIDIEQVRALRSSGTMLTQDENVVLVEMDVQYRISDPVKYLYSLTNPDQTLLEATDSALRFVVGHTMMDDILTTGREMVRQNTRDLLTSIIDPYNTGLSIVEVNFLPARPPEEVKAAFDDAIAAQEDEQRYKREAEAYANEVLPKADGKVQRIRQEAEGYRSQVVLDAQGEVSRFEKVLPEFNAAPEITRTRIYLETMQEVLGKSQKILLDTPEGSTPVLYLPMPQAGQMLQSSTVRETLEPESSVQESSPRPVSSESSSSRNTQYPPLNTYSRQRSR
ncbi:MAG: FtsH protease activity modulator HflK [Succinivibrio sp.]|nr:FtsH protease activity modulator HflK [Succinivibrio sp.]